MTEPLKPAFKKSLTMQGDTLVVRALVPDATGENFHPITFEKPRIDYVTEVAPGLSAIALKTGVKIPVAMDYEALERSVYFTDVREQSVLDLRAVTGPAAQNVNVPELATDIASAAQKEPEPEAGQSFEDKPVTIAIFARQPQEQNFVMFTFKDTDVNWAGVAGEDGRNGKLTRVPFHGLRGPFGGREVLFDLPRPAFMELYNKAKMDGRTELDLRDLTRRRDPDKTLQKRKPPPSTGPDF